MGATVMKKGSSCDAASSTYPRAISDITSGEYLPSKLTGGSLLWVIEALKYSYVYLDSVSRNAFMVCIIIDLRIKKEIRSIEAFHRRVVVVVNGMGIEQLSGIVAVVTELLQIDWKPFVV